MPYTDREVRLEEIRERVEAHERGVKGAAQGDEASDLRFLLSEIDRLRKIEEAAREFCASILPPIPLRKQERQGLDRLKAKLERN